MAVAATIRLTQVEAVPLAVVRSRTRPSDLSTVVPHACGVVWDFIRAQGLKGGRHVALYLNDAIDLEVGVELALPFHEADVVRSQTPAGTVVAAVHYGPYHGLGGAHAAIRTWTDARGHRLTGVRWEIYGHWEQEWNTDPSRIRTDVFYQVAL